MPDPVTRATAATSLNVTNRLDDDVAAAKLKLGRQLGSGYFSTAFDAKWGDKHVAVKVPNRNVTTWKIFQGEARTLARFDDSRRLPHLVALLPPGKSAAAPDGALVLDYVDGVSLRDLGKIPAEKARDLVVTLLEGDLKQLHSRGLVHRDIAPQNLKVDGDTMRLLDFGSAIEHMQKDDYCGSQPWTVPPGHPARQRDDVYAVAGTLFTMITGYPPPTPILGAGPLFDVIRAMREPDADRRPTLDEAAARLRSIPASSLSPSADDRLFSIYGAESRALNDAGEPNRGDHEGWARSVGRKAAMTELRRKIDWLFSTGDRNRYANFYGDFCARVASFGVSFGYDARDNPDRAGHYNWARSAPPAQLKSEIFQRLDVLESL